MLYFDHASSPLLEGQIGATIPGVGFFSSGPLRCQRFRMLSRELQKHVLAGLELAQMISEHRRSKGVYLPEAIGVNECLGG